MRTERTRKWDLFMSDSILSDNTDKPFCGTGKVKAEISADKKSKNTQIKKRGTQSYRRRVTRRGWHRPGNPPNTFPPRLQPRMAARYQTSPARRSATRPLASGLTGFGFAAQSLQTTTHRDRPHSFSSHRAVDPPSSSSPFRCHRPGSNPRTCNDSRCRPR